MKTKEEWVKQAIFQTNYQASDKELMPIIEQIQLDAYKQGMIDANQVIMDEYSMNDMTACGISCMLDDIIARKLPNKPYIRPTE